MHTIDHPPHKHEKTSRLKKDASNFDDYMLAAGLATLVGILML